MKIVFTLLFLSLLSSASGKAQDKTTPASPQATDQKPKTSTDGSENSSIAPEREHEIRVLLELVGTQALLEQTLVQMEHSVRPVLESSLPPGEYREKLIAAFFVKFRSKFTVKQMLDLAVPVYDKYFTSEEIRGLIQFYQTPLGQKSVSVLPQLTTELMNEGRKLGEDAGRTSMMEVLAENPELEKQMEEAQKASQP
jgi:hypothetical protein